METQCESTECTPSLGAFRPVSFGHETKRKRDCGMKRRRNKIRVLIHFVWATHERLPLITPEIERDVYRYMEKVCQDERCEVLAIGGMPDHVHLLAAISNTVSLSALMQNVKGGSSRFISHK